MYGPNLPPTTGPKNKYTMLKFIKKKREILLLKYFIVINVGKSILWRKWWGKRIEGFIDNSCP